MIDKKCVHSQLQLRKNKIIMNICSTFITIYEQILLDFVGPFIEATAGHRDQNQINSMLES